MFLDLQWNLNPAQGIGWRGMGDWQNGNDCRVAIFECHSQNDDARAVLATLIVPRAVFVMPQIGVVQDEAWLGRREGHKRSLFVVQ
jgi:hypothetical protein